MDGTEYGRSCAYRQRVVSEAIVYHKEFSVPLSWRELVGYLMLGLIGETEEVVTAHETVIRGESRLLSSACDTTQCTPTVPLDEAMTQYRHELGDTCWYVAMIEDIAIRRWGRSIIWTTPVGMVTTNELLRHAGRTAESIKKAIRNGDEGFDRDRFHLAFSRFAVSLYELCTVNGGMPMICDMNIAKLHARHGQPGATTS